MIWIRAFLVLLLCGVLAGGAAADERWDRLATPYFSHIGRDNGLPHEIVMDFAQDREGFVWIATQGGLARWDGFRLRVFTHVEGDSGSLPDSTVMRLLSDDRGQLWVASSSGAVARFDPATERFQALPIPQGVVGVPAGLIADGAGGVWIGGSDGLGHFTLGSWQPDRGITGDVNGAVRCLMRGADGTLWICGSTKLFRRGPQDHDLAPVAAPPGADPIRSLMTEEAGNLWFGTEHAGVGLLDPVTGERRLLVDPNGDAGPIRELAPSAPDEIWAATTFGGILVVSAKSGLRSRIIGHDDLRSALGLDLIYALMRDRSGMLWVGGLGGAYLHPAGPVDTIWPSLDPARGPWGADVLDLCADRSGQTWLATRQLGLLTLGVSDAGPPTLRPVKTVEGSEPPFFSCTVAADGTVFAGQPQGLVKIPSDAVGTPRVHAPSVVLDPEIRVTELLVDGANLWIGGEQGLYRADLQGHIQQHWEYRADDPQSLSNNGIETIVADRDGNLWIGTHGGLDRLDPKSGRIERILPSADAGSLPGSVVSSLLFDRSGRLWVGTIGGAGIGILEHPEAAGPRRFRRIGASQGLPSTNIGTLLEDDAGRIWVSSTDGLAVIRPDDFHLRRLSSADGVAIQSYWVHSGLRLADGTLLFGGFKGLSAVHPDRLADWTYRAPVVVTQLRIGGRPRPSGQPIVLGPGQRSFQVEFAALDYSAPELNRYAYRLLGYDTDWLETDAQHRLAAYANLPPGDYTLELRGSNRMGVWTESATSIPVRVLPAWYETWWLRSLAALGLIALIAATVRLRTMGLERNHRALVLNRLALEREVARRTVDLERSQSALERSNATLAASAETLRRLGEIGRLVTASLDSGDVLAALCRNVGSILDAESVAIWLPDGKPVRLRVAYGVGHGEALPTLAVPLDDPDAGVARAARERRDILIESPTGAHATALFGPLLVQDQLFGVLAVETSRPRAYGEREQFAFASFCAYGATALANAEAHRDLARANAELGRLASHDSLTGLANRRYFFDMAVEEVARAGRYRRCLSLLVVDLDTFKSVNDTYGHLAGDAALQAASRCLQQSLRQTDLAARYGGEEFIALLPETGLDGAVQVAERFRALLAATEIRHNDVSFRITASVGVAAWRFGEAAIEPAIDRADRALYRVKSTGRNRVAREPAEGNGADVQPGAIS